MIATLRASFVLALGLPLCAQDAKPAQDPAFDALVTAVDAAHRKGDKTETFDRFTGTLSISQLGRNTDRIEVRLDAKFLGPDLLKYSVDETGRRIERGQDKNKKVWGRVGDKSYWIAGRDYSDERKEFRRHIRLARQLVEFLDPGKTMRKMTDRSKVQQRKDVKIGRVKRGDCEYVHGVLDDFPLYATAGGSNKVKLELWLKDGLLDAIQATSLDEKGKPAGNPEYVLLDDYTDKDGVQVPTRLTIYRVDPAPQKKAPVARIEILSLELKPELEAKDFDRLGLAQKTPPPKKRGG